MSEFNSPSLNALPAASMSRKFESAPQDGVSVGGVPLGGMSRSGVPPSGNPLPAQIVEKADVARERLETARLYQKQPESESAASQSESQRTEALDETVEQAVARLNDYVQRTERTLNFQVDEKAGLTVIRVYDKQSEELIRQIPSEEAISLARKLNKEEPLMLFSAQV